MQGMVASLKCFRRRQKGLDSGLGWVREAAGHRYRDESGRLEC